MRIENVIEVCIKSKKIKFLCRIICKKLRNKDYLISKRNKEALLRNKKKIEGYLINKEKESLSCKGKSGSINQKDKEKERQLYKRRKQRNKLRKKNEILK